MKKLLAIVSIILLLTVACKQEAVEEAAPAVDELKSAVEELAPVETVNCFINLTVLFFCATDVLRIVAVNFTFAAFPKTVLSVTVIEAVPSPDIVSATLTISP